MTIDDRYDQFCIFISSIAHSIQVIKKKALDEFQLRGSNVSTLFLLYRHPEGLTVTELTEYSREDKAAISRNVNELIRKGYARTEGEGERKYRTKVSLTQTGLIAAGKLKECICAAVTSGGDAMTEDVRKLFYECLSGIEKNLAEYVRQLG